MLSISAGNYIRQFVGGITAGASYTISVWVKKPVSGGANAIRLTSNNVNAWSTGFSQKFTLTSTWQRITATGVLASSNTSAYVIIGGKTEANADDPDCVGGVLTWGAQLNTGSVAGPYVPTTTTAASSTADAINITSLTGGINNIRTIYAKVRTPASGIRGIISLNDNSSSNRLELLTNGTDPRAVAVTSGGTVADINGGTIAANTTFNIAARFDGDNYAVSINGAPVVTDNAGARAIVDRIFLGRTQAGEYLNGYIERLATWTTPISDARLQAIAS